MIKKKKIYCGHKTYRLFNIFSYGKEHLVSFRFTYLQWTTMGTLLCDLLPKLSLMFLIMSVRSWGFSGSSLLAHFRNWNCFTDRLSFLCRQRRCWVKAEWDVEMTRHITCTEQTLSQLQVKWMLCYLDMTDQNVAADESWEGVGACHLNLNFSKCFLFFIPIHTVSLLWTQKNMHVYSVLHVPGAYKVDSVCKAYNIQHLDMYASCLWDNTDTLSPSLQSESMTIVDTFFWWIIIQKSAVVSGRGVCAAMRARVPQ